MTKQQEIRDEIVRRVPSIKERVLIYGDGHHCLHHPDDPCHGSDCYEVPISEITALDVLVALGDGFTLNWDGQLRQQGDGTWWFRVSLPLTQTFDHWHPEVFEALHPLFFPV